MNEKLELQELRAQTEYATILNIIVEGVFNAINRAHFKSTLLLGEVIDLNVVPEDTTNTGKGQHVWPLRRKLI